MALLEQARQAASEFTPERVAALPLDQIPLIRRRLDDLRVCLTREWLTSYYEYRQLLDNLAYYFHRDEHLSVMPAKMKAGIDPAVVSASRQSLSLKSAVQSIDAIVRQMDGMLDVRSPTDDGGGRS